MSSLQTVACSPRALAKAPLALYVAFFYPIFLFFCIPTRFLLSFIFHLSTSFLTSRYLSLLSSPFFSPFLSSTLPFSSLLSNLLCSFLFSPLLSYLLLSSHFFSLFFRLFYFHLVISSVSSPLLCILSYLLFPSPLFFHTSPLLVRHLSRKMS